jgi:hypothetical protein
MPQPIRPRAAGPGLRVRLDRSAPRRRIYLAIGVRTIHVSFTDRPNDRTLFSLVSCELHRNALGHTGPYEVADRLRANFVPTLITINHKW